MRSSGYTKEQEELILVLAEKGVPDLEIAKSMGIRVANVNFRTTKFWEQKMQDKNV